ncbi:fer-1-like protein 6 [Amyelois transitella]|uniref:fer-1-like protein 6 n=1 Tax=Amyelois transitella TaxID=680683 RepID=UPI002990448E|nr:fer-1-like protein 6 [Amyelois transitella]
MKYLRYFADYPSNGPAKFLVRVYVLKILDVASKDNSEDQDPSIVISLGKKRYKDHQRNSQSSDKSMFGEMYELRCTIPEEYLLSLSLYDSEGGSSEELIGQTSIDLEDRIYTKHNACVGLSRKYDLIGPAKWRDRRKPSAILEEICCLNHLPPPSYPDVATVVVNGVEYRNHNNTNSEDSIWSLDKKENICLSILHQWHTLPLCGYHLVPEHVETRTLYRPDKPGLSQGKLLMWIDIFPLNSKGIPPPVDITPPKVEEYELRIVLWDLYGLNIRNLMTKKSVDVFIRGFIGCSDQAQTTDVCYGITDKASFNWRMIFHICYQHSESMLIVKNRGPFTEYEEKIPPNFVLQIIDNTSEQIIASLTLSLTDFPRGVKLPQNCSLNFDEHRKINLFLTRSVRAWWPLEGADNCGKDVLMGAIDLEMTLLPKEQADLVPVGLGRGPPSPLPDPHESSATCFLCYYFSGREANNEDHLCGKSSFIRRHSFMISLTVFAIIVAIYFILCVDTSIVQEYLQNIGILGGDISEEPMQEANQLANS